MLERLETVLPCEAMGVVRVAESEAHSRESRETTKLPGTQHASYSENATLCCKHDVALNRLCVIPDPCATR
jgi:hypothetical protein